jgi:hypothetical protein
VILPANGLDLYVMYVCNPLGISHIVTTLTFFAGSLTCIILIGYLLCRTADCSKPGAENLIYALSGPTLDNRTPLVSLKSQQLVLEDYTGLVLAHKVMRTHMERVQPVIDCNKAIVLLRNATDKQFSHDFTLHLTELEAKSLIIGSDDYFPAHIHRFNLYEQHCLVLRAQVARDKVAHTLSLPAQSLAAEIPAGFLVDEELQALAALDGKDLVPGFMAELSVQVNYVLLDLIQEQRQKALALLPPQDVVHFVPEPDTISLDELAHTTTIVTQSDYKAVLDNILDSLIGPH